MYSQYSIPELTKRRTRAVFELQSVKTEAQFHLWFNIVTRLNKAITDKMDYLKQAKTLKRRTANE